MSLASFLRLHFHVYEKKTLVCNVFIDKTIYKQKETVIVNSHTITPYNLQKMSTTYEKLNILLNTGISWDVTFGMREIYLISTQARF